MKEQKKPLTVDDLPELATMEELALFFRVSVPTAKKWVQSDSLPQAFKLGGRWMIPKEDIINLAKSMYGKKD